MSSVIVAGDTSGSVTLQAPAVSGSTVLTLPAVSGTLISSGGAASFTDLTTTGNTILGNASTDTLNVGNGGLVKDASGNVGIGTASPAYKLDVSKGSSGVVAKFTGGTSAYIYAGGTDVYFAGDTSGNDSYGINSTSHFLNYYTNGIERMRIDASGNLGLGVTPSAWGGYTGFQVGRIAIMGNTTDATARFLNNAFYDGTNYKYIQSAAANLFSLGGAGGIQFYTAPVGTAGNAITFTQAMTLDANGDLGLGTTDPTQKLEIRKDTTTAGSEGNILIQNYTSGTTPYYIGGIFGAAYRDVRFPAYCAGIDFYRTSSAGGLASSGEIRFYTDGNGGTQAELRAAEKMRLDASGNLLLGYAAVYGSTQHAFYKPVAQGTSVCVISGYPSSNDDTAIFYGSSGTQGNAAATSLRMGRNTTTSRTINAAGTINASGADYAEYMTKADDFVLAKGDVVGINSNGKLTNVFAEAVSFVVKSTDPSYVGGDAWGTEEAIGLTLPKQPVRAEDDTDETFAEKETQYTTDKAVFDDALEAARQLVDRIAFAGQVPVNVLGATAGQYIIPVNDNGAIKGEAVTSPTFEQYQTAVGKVIAIEADGRAKIIVKVA